MRAPTFPTVLSIAVLGTLTAIPPAQALTVGTTTLPKGSSLSGPCNTSGSGPSTFDGVQTGTESKYDYRLPPGGGAIDSWSFNTSGATPGTPYALVVARGSGAGGTFSIVGSDVETVPPSPPAVATFALSPPIAVKAGDVLGFEAFPDTTASCLFENGSLTAADVVAGGAPSGSSVDLTPDFASALVNGSADLVQSEDIGVTQRALPASITTDGDGVLAISLTSSGASDGPVTISDTVPAGLAIVSVSPGSPACSVAGQTVTCTLSSASNAAVTIVVSATVAGTDSNTALATGTLSDPNPANNSASATLDVTAPPMVTAPPAVTTPPAVTAPLGATAPPSQNPAPKCHVVSLSHVPRAVAKSVVRALGCAVGRVSVKSSRSVPKGDVISTSPRAGATAALGTTVAIVSSSGKPRHKKRNKALTASFPHAGRSVATARDSSTTRGRVVAGYGRLPLTFVDNRGQSAHTVRVLAQGMGFAAGLTDDALVLALSRPGAAPTGVQMRFLGANPASRPVTGHQLPGHVNYLIGSNRGRWHTGLQTYGTATYGQLWPGIDATVSGLQHELEYTFTVAPGADPAGIRLAFGGVAAPRLRPDGSLQLSPGLRQLAPHAYQTIGGREVTVPCRYSLRHGRVTIHVGRYDRSRALVIDPTLAVAYSTYLGGGDAEQANAIAVDPAGEAFVTGTTASTDFATTGAFQTSNKGNDDAFVTKLSADGTTALYTTYLGGSGLDQGNGIAVDATGEAYVAGYTTSLDFPAVNPLPNQPDQGGADRFESAFIAKLDSTGTSLGYSTYLGGCCYDTADAIALDGQGDAYVTGQTRSFDFPVSDTAYQTAAGGPSAFVTKLTPTDTLSYSTFLGGAYTTGKGIAVDALGQAWIAGDTGSEVYPTTSNAYQSTGVLGDGGTTGVVTELDATGSNALYSTYLGGSSAQDTANGVAVDSGGNAFVTGTTFSDDFPTTTGAEQTSYGGGASDGFVTEFHADGSVGYSTYLGGATDDIGSAIATDGSGRAYVTGSTAPESSSAQARPLDGAVTSSGGFPVVAPTQAQPGGGADAFVSTLAAGGGALAFSTYLGGAGDDDGLGIAVDSAGAAYVTGSTQSSNFPTVNPQQDVLRGGEDAFVTKIAPVAPPSPPPGPPPPPPGAPSTPVSAAGSQSTGVPVNLTPPVISGRPLPGDTLHCSTGTWTNSPTGYSSAWKLAGVPIAGATAGTYVVQIGDEASGPADALTCVVTASNWAGASAPATSAGVLVAVPGTTRCPRPAGALSGSSVGVLRLGMARAQARHRLRRFNVTQNRFDNFCLFAGWGIRVAYPSAALLRHYPSATGRRVRGRIILALTANPFYRYRGTPPGSRLSTLAHRLRLATPFHIGRNYWYIVAASPSAGIFKVRNGVVQEVGLVSRALTATHADQKRLLNSFKNG